MDEPPNFCVRGLAAAYGSQISPSGCRVSACGCVGGRHPAARHICNREVCDARHAESSSPFGLSRERDQRMSWMLFATSRVLAICRTLGVVSEQPRGHKAPGRENRYGAREIPLGTARIRVRIRNRHTDEKEARKAISQCITSISVNSAMLDSEKGTT